MQKIFRVGLVALFALCLGTNLVPVIAGTYSPQDYSFTYEEYGSYVDDFSYTKEKSTSSSIYVTCNQSTGDFFVTAYGAYYVGGALSDASGGNRLYFGAGGEQDGKLANYVNEWGYSATAIRGVYHGDSYFSAAGQFTPDY